MEALSQTPGIPAASRCFLAKLICTFGPPAHTYLQLFARCAALMLFVRRRAAEAAEASEQTWVVMCTPQVSLQHTLVGGGMFHSEGLLFNVPSNCTLMFGANLIQTSAAVSARRTSLGRV